MDVATSMVVVVMTSMMMVEASMANVAILVAMAVVVMLSAKVSAAS